MKEVYRGSAMYLILLFMLPLSGCMSAAQHGDQLSSAQEREMTVGIVQREIRKGMSQAEVAERLGSPNIVTRDAEGRETWIYDKIASEASYSRDGGGTGLLLNLLVGYGREAGAVSTTRRTLTVVIKFQDYLVDSYSYHSSKF